MSDTYDKHQGALQAAITGVVDQGGIITHYVVVAAGITDDGDEYTTSITSPGLPLWMTHGLLSYEAAATTPQPVWSQEEEDE